jgi:hypothetical protein
MRVSNFVLRFLDVTLSVSLVPISAANSGFPAQKHTLKELSADMGNVKVPKYKYVAL